MTTKTKNGNGNGTTAKQKTVYIPYMCDHAYVLGAAMEAHNIPTEVMPQPTDETLAIGLDLCKGSECLPCFTTTGDMILRSRQEDFEPEQSVLLMATTAGPCRFGQYAALQRDIMDNNGLAEVDIVSPNSENSYKGFGDNPAKLRLLVWQGVVAVDLAQKLLYQYRPYELNKGQTDELYQEALTRIVEATKAGGKKHLVNTMKWLAVRFEELPADRSTPRPLVGLVGEIYLRFNNYGNQEIVRQVEAAGGEVMVATMMEWFYFTNWYTKVAANHLGMYLSALGMAAIDKYQQHLEHKLVKPVEHLLTHSHESPVAELMDNILPYYDPYLATEAVLTMGKAIEFAKSGLCGILNIMPFSCMPGIITAGIAPSIRADFDNIPWLDVIYDTQEGTNINTRLEAFMYQAIQFQRRNAAVPVHS